MTIFPNVKASERRGMQPAHFVESVDPIPSKNADGAKDVNTSYNLTDLSLFLPLFHRNLKMVSLYRDIWMKRAVAKPLAYHIGIAMDRTLSLTLTNHSTINFPSEEQNRFLSYCASDMNLSYSRETDTFTTSLPLRTIHMSETEADATKAFIDGRFYPRADGVVRDTVPFQAVYAALDTLFRERQDAFAALRAALKQDTPEARSHLSTVKSIGQTLLLVIAKAKTDLCPRYRRKINETLLILARKHKYGSERYDPNIHIGALALKQRQFRSPHIWIQTLEENVGNSHFSARYGVDGTPHCQVTCTSDPGTRTAETQKISTGHLAQVCPGFEHAIRYLQKQIDKLQTERDDKVNDMESIKVLETHLKLAHARVGDVVIRVAATATDVSTNAEVILALKDVQKAQKALYKALDKERKALKHPKEDLLYSVLIQKKINKFANSVLFNATRWNSGFDLYATSNFNAKNSNLRHSKTGKPGISGSFFLFA
ncbi:hypothetical protein HDU98_005036 [Podochytrium sp. JEL0797]|nr:hypothetical protein HDU98_005036 [Podochytrium sp. JEL0797]